MKSFMIKLFFSLACVATLRVITASEYEQFLQGNDAYQSGDFKKALELYTAIPDKGPVLWHNIGLCYKHQSDDLNAFIAFSQAQKNASSALFVKVTELRDQVGDILGIAREHFIVRMMQWCSAYIPLMAAQLLVLFLLLLLSVLCIVLNNTHTFAKLLLALLCVIAMAGLYGLRWINGRTYGIILQDSLVYVGPNEDFHSNGSVKMGQCVSSMKHKEGWFKITTHDVTGWVNQTRVVPIE